MLSATITKRWFHAYFQTTDEHTALNIEVFISVYSRERAIQSIVYWKRFLKLTQEMLS